jgi:beta-galactosidase
MPIVDEDLASRLGAWVTAGGKLWLGPRSGAKTPTLIAHAPAPGPLLAWTGAKVTRVDALRPGVTRTMTRGNGSTASYGVWADLLEPTSEGGGAPAEVLARYDDGAYRGAAAYVRAVRGAGEVRVMGAWLDHSDMMDGFGSWLNDGGVATQRLPDGVVRAGGWTINFADQAVTVDGREVASLDALLDDAS